MPPSGAAIDAIQPRAPTPMSESSRPASCSISSAYSVAAGWLRGAAQVGLERVAEAAVGVL